MLHVKQLLIFFLFYNPGFAATRKSFFTATSLTQNIRGKYSLQLEAFYTAQHWQKQLSEIKRHDNEFRKQKIVKCSICNSR